MSVFDIADLSRSTVEGNLSTERARAVFDTLGEGVIVWSVDGLVVDCTRTAGQIRGVSRADLRSMTFEDILRVAWMEMGPVTEHGQPLATREFPAVRVRRDRQPVIGQVLGITRPDGRRLWLEVDVRPVHDGTDSDLVVASFRDITERKEAEERSRALSAIVESSSDASFRQSLDATIESWNPAAD